MILRASLMGEGRYDEFLAQVEVESDTPEKVWESIRRTIVGRVSKQGPIWDAFMDAWQPFTHKEHDDGRKYFLVNMLQINHDFYGFGSLLHLSADSIRIVTVERYHDGSLEEYTEKVRRRNERVQAYHDKWNTYQVTVNDMREIEGLNRIAGEFGDRILSKSQTDDVRNMVWPRTILAGLSRNTIV